MDRSKLHHQARERLHRYTTEHTNHYDVVPAPPFEAGFKLGEHGRDVDAAMAALGRMATPPPTGIMRFLRSRILARQEAISSSGMEGTQSTLDAVLGLDSDSEADAPARQVRSYAIALDTLTPEARAQGPDIFSVDFFCKIHRFVMSDMPDYKDVPGQLRRSVVWIGGAGSDISYSTWNPPGPEHLSACLNDTARYMRADGPHAVSQPILLRIAIAHAHFEAVHPFLDGNGRVGRLLIPLMLTAEGYEPVYISPWIETNKALYYEGLKAAQQQLDHGPLTGVLAKAIIETEKELLASEAALKRLYDIWRSTVKLRHNSSAARLLAILPWLPVLSVKTACEILGVTPKAAGDGIKALCQAGILKELTGLRRNRVFEAQDVMRIITRPLGAPPLLPNEEMGTTEDIDWSAS